MRLLGAILCGGGATRFGSDKALAELGGRSLVAHVRDRLAPQVAAIVACGRPILDLEGLSDRPGPDLGPLAGLNAALHAAADRGFDAVLSVPCDTPVLPPDLCDRLAGDGDAFVAELPVIGVWRSSLAPLLDRHLAEGGNRSMRGWAERVGARSVSIPAGMDNVNRQDDLERLRVSHGGVRE